MRIFTIYFLFTLGLIAKGMPDKVEVMILSDKVGTEIDEHENRFYRIFPNEKGLIDAQIVRINDSKFRLLIVKNINGQEKKVRRYLTKNEFQELRKYVDDQPELTEEAMVAMYEGMDFLRAEKIINEIPKPQYVVLRYSQKKKINGTLFKVEENILHIQTATSIEQVSLDDLDKISYRS